MSDKQSEQTDIVVNNQPSDGQDQQPSNNQDANSNYLHLPHQPKHTIQDDIIELNDQIQKKRNSQRKSVFSNHEDMNLSHLIQQHNQENEEKNKEDNDGQTNEKLDEEEESKQNHDKDQAMEEENNENSNEQQGNIQNLSSQLPVKPKHTVQDDIKELNEQIVQRKSVRRASRFQAESTNHLSEFVNDLQHNANLANEQNNKDESKQNEHHSSAESDDDEEDQNKIKSLHDLNENQENEGKSHQHVQTEEDDFNNLNENAGEHHTSNKQKSITELQEEAKQKPNAFNEVIKLNCEIQSKRGLKRKSTFSVPLIQHEDLEDNNEKKDEQKDQENAKEKEHPSPAKEKKQNAFDEIIKLNNEIHFRSNLKRKSTFSLPVIEDDDLEDKPKSVNFKDGEEENKIKEEPSMEEKGEKDDKEDQNEAVSNQKKQNALVEILKMNNDIQVKRQLTRKSTFSLPVHIDEESEDKKEKEQEDKQSDKDEDEEESQPSSTSLKQNINENADKLEQINQDENEEQSQQKKPNAYQDIVELNNQISSKRSLTRKSTFSVPHIEDNDLEDNDEKKKLDQSKITEESHLNDTTEGVEKKPNALNEIIELNNEIQHKRGIKRKSTFSLPQIEDDNPEQEKQENVENQTNEDLEKQREAQRKHNALNDILTLNHDIQVKRDFKRKSTFSIPVIEDDDDEQEKKEKPRSNKLNENEDDQRIEEEENESEEAKLLRQRKKKNLMDYKEQEADHPVMKEKRDKTLDKKNVFMKENKGHYRRVIHPTNKQQNKHENNKLEEPVLELNVQTKDDNQETKENDQKEQILSKSVNNSFEKTPNTNVQTSPEKSTKPYEKKSKNNDRRDEFALQRKLEYLTANSAKNELLRKEKGSIPHNKFIAQELSKEMKIREANKRKRELESMLAQINREIQYIRKSDPDYDNLVIDSLQIKSLHEDKQKSSRQQQNNLNGGNSLYYSTESRNKNSDVILPVIKKNNQIKEMIKIAEDHQASKDALSLIQKYKREKEYKRQKRDEEFHQVNDQIVKEVELRRQQNESLHEKILLEKRQKLLHKKQQYESKKLEQQQLIVASKNFVKDLRSIGPGKVSNAYLNQLNQIDNEYKYGQYQTPELDAHKLGLSQIRNLAKGEYSGGGSLPNFMKNKPTDNSDLKKLLEENQINRDREIKITENRKDLYNKRIDYSKSVKNNLLKGGKKLDISSNLLFQDDAFNKNGSLGSLHVSSIDTKRRRQQENEPVNKNEEQDENKQRENIQIGNSSSTKSNNSNSKVWRVVKH